MNRFIVTAIYGHRSDSSELYLPPQPWPCNTKLSNWLYDSLVNGLHDPSVNRLHVSSVNQSIHIHVHHGQLHSSSLSGSHLCVSYGALKSTIIFTHLPRVHHIDEPFTLILMHPLVEGSHVRRVVGVASISLDNGQRHCAVGGEHDLSAIVKLQVSYRKKKKVSINRRATLKGNFDFWKWPNNE